MEEKIQVSSEVSRRYAKALFAIVKESSLEQKITKEIKELLKVFGENKEFNKLFNSPVLSSKNQIKLIDNLFSYRDSKLKKIKVSKNIFFYFKVLASNGKLKILIDSLYNFNNMIKLMQQEINVNVISAIPINETVMENINSILKGKTKKKINLSTVVDRSIIGGIILQTGSNLIDASLRSKILKINNVIKGAN
ncbi:MAG: ATP synthase F1 subunit delta [Rickettsiales bacterium TMED254]|nr:ATP synthase F1 subunit delta [Rickettsiales bacterium]RPF77142.1 MAG: ATP synthase F1 subunit delta [Rickettsiales bacterium TMED254]|tara:strand:- start:229 stop:810 length:582 start_codon:yes stop_codon:yes gene_type:complete